MIATLLGAVGGRQLRDKPDALTYGRVRKISWTGLFVVLF
jgi:hypothetical protein